MGSPRDGFDTNNNQHTSVDMAAPTAEGSAPTVNMAAPTAEESAPVWVQVVSLSMVQVRDPATGARLGPRRLELRKLRPQETEDMCNHSGFAMHAVPGRAAVPTVREPTQEQQPENIGHGLVGHRLAAPAEAAPTEAEEDKYLVGWSSRAGWS